MSKAGYVYVITSAGRRAKIGISRDPEMRLGHLQSGCPVSLTLEHSVYVADAKAVEDGAHGLLGACRLHGEWFDIEPAEAVKALNRAVAKWAGLDDEETPISNMKGAEFHAGLARLQLLPYEASPYFGVSRGQIYRYTQGKTPIPETIAMLLREYLKHGLQDPALVDFNTLLTPCAGT